MAKKGTIIQQSCLLWIMDWRGSQTLHMSAFCCVIKDTINAFTKLQPISDIYKGKNSSFIYKENSTKLLKDIFQKDLSVFSECSGVTYLEFFIVLP